MSKINFKKDKIPFTQVANEMLNDSKLSFKAKGIYAYLYSKPEGWDFAINRIARDCAEGRTAVDSGIKELEGCGLLTRKRLKNGRVDYKLHSQMQKKPLSGNPKVGKPQSGKTCTISNKDKEVIKSISNKEQATELRVNHLIDSFKTFNPAYKSWFGNATQRKACSSLLELMELDKLINLVQKALPVINRRQYAPTITTPHQLLQKYAQLESYLEKEKLNSKKNTIL